MKVRRAFPGLIFFGLSVVVTGVAVLLALEGYLLLTGRAPITWYTECAVSAYPLATFFVVAVISAGLGSLLAHFFWGHVKP